MQRLIRRRTLRFSLLSITARAAVLLPAPRAEAQQAPIGLGTAGNLAVLAGQGVTITGPTTVNGDLGTWPNPAVVGADLTVNGSNHAADAVAQQAQADTTIAYNDAAGRTPITSVATEFGGQILTPGVYNSSAGTFEITGTLTLNAEGDPNAVFVLQAASTARLTQVVNTPTTTTSGGTTPTPTPTPGATRTTPRGSGGSGPTLPATGTGLAATAGAGLLAILVGAVLLATKQTTVSRRRQLPRPR